MTERTKEDTSLDSGKRGFLKGMTAVVGASLLTGVYGCKGKECPSDEPPECPPCESKEAETAVKNKNVGGKKPKGKPDSDVKKWVGKLDRAKVNWDPKIDAEKCIGCAMCMHCGKNVFDFVDNKAVVARKGQCTPGCRTCSNLCPGRAITFPDPKTLRDLFKREKVYDKMPGWMEEAGKIKKA